MGLGDSILATARAKREHQKHKLRCVFTDGRTNFYEPLVHANNPRIAQTLRDGERYVAIPDFPGCRPYIAGYEPDRFIWDREYKAEPGELYLTRKEKALALHVPYIVVEPSVKGEAQQNKDWGWEKWVELTREPLPWVQMGSPDRQRLPDVPFIETNFRAALGILSGAALLVTTDGALHHAAAAMNVPAVVIWGGFTSPRNLGYDAHINLWSGAEPCGRWKHRCSHCERAMADITVSDVLGAVRRVWEAELVEA